MAEVTDVERAGAARQARAGRILDAAAELLLRFGYRRTTIEDVAREAGVGKGTIYLHWRTREQLFEAVVQREALAATDEIVAAIQQDPTLALLHRLTGFYFGSLLRRPILRAVFVGDLELLGSLAANTDLELESRQDAAFKKYLCVLAEHGLIRDGFGIDDLSYVYQSICLGFLVSESVLTEPTRVPEERMIELLEATIRRTFEPARPPSLKAVRAVAPRVIAAFQEIADVTRAHGNQ